MNGSRILSGSRLLVREIMNCLQLLPQAPGEELVLTNEPAAFFKKYARGRCAVFTGRKSVEASGTWDEFSTAVPQSERFSGIEPEPCVETVERMTAFLDAGNYDTVFAIGGGSVLDAAKAAFLVHQTKIPLQELFGVNMYSQKFPGKDLARIIAVPTTSGTGSEATQYSNIVDHNAGVKKLIAEAQCVPLAGCVVPRYTNSMPRDVTLATGCDALAHLLEGFLNVRADSNHPEGNTWALAGIRLVKEFLPGALVNDPCAREKMAIAAALGGMTIRFKSTGLPHLCSFSWFGRIAHGIAAIMLLPESWRYYLGNPAVAERTMLLSEIFPGHTPEAVIDSFRAFLTELGVPEKLNAFPDLSPELMERTACSAGENKMKLELAPRPVPVEESRFILQNILLKSYGE